MFKNVIVYRIASDWGATLEQVSDSLAPVAFEPCGPTQEKSAGWVPPRGQAHGALVEAVDGQWILRFMMEAKTVPGSVVTRKVKEQVAAIELAEGRKPGKKEIRELKEEVRLSLMPMAFTRQAAVTVWLDPQARFLVIDAASQAKADEVVTGLVKSLDGFGVMALNTQTAPATAMAQWLTTQEPPQGFSIDRECELKASDDSKAVVRYAHHPLDIEEVRQHIAGGKLPTRLALTWSDRLSFVLTEGLQVKKLSFQDVVFEGTDSPQGEDGFDADAAISTAELAQMLPDLLLALDGEVVPGLPATAAPAPSRPAAEPADPVDPPF
ncbi:recombination-associated protein RdgC [Variovorax terrae]|uniref:Recombination-associated protein RdgC n=1 Tax=Variovorax terrae TaxID=2923278 RepID=A0A9X1VUE9_9BURK|nr:recombination-associated protein RdgC [Variovorax terrae]